MREVFYNQHLRLLVAVAGLVAGVLGSVVMVGLGQAFAAIREVALNTRVAAPGAPAGRRVALAIVAVVVQVLGVLALAGTLAGFVYAYGRITRE